MTTLKKEFSRLKHHFDFIHTKVDEGCDLFNEDQPAEAEIAFTEALRYSESLIEEYPDELPYQISLAETHHLLSLGYSHIEEFEKARAHLQEAFTIYQSIKGIGPDHEVLLNASAAHIEYAAGNDEKALSILKKDLQNIEKGKYEEFHTGSYVYCSDLVLLAEVYFKMGQYKKAVKTTRQAISMRSNSGDPMLVHLPLEYIRLLNIAAFQSQEKDDLDFHREVLYEGIDACRKAEEAEASINLLSHGTFYQDLLKLLFFNDEEKELKRVYKELMDFCDQHLDEEPKLLKHKISGQLNYGVFCSKIGDMATAEDVVNEAISGCMDLEEDGPELTLFMVSALNILSNLQWEQGEQRGALRDMSSECKILGDYLEAHVELCPTLLPLLTELTINQCSMLHDTGQHEKSEELVEHLKTNIKQLVRDNHATQSAAYFMAITRIADMHQSVGMDDQARKEFEEALYIMKELKSELPELAESFEELEEELHNRLSHNDL